MNRHDRRRNEVLYRRAMKAAKRRVDGKYRRMVERLLKVSA